VLLLTAMGSDVAEVAEEVEAFREGEAMVSVGGDMREKERGGRR